MGLNIEVGRRGEELVARRLSEQGWVILDRNWHCARGEIDLVARDGDAVVAIEVKTRRVGGGCGGPLEAVTPVKVARLRRLLAMWLAQQDATFPDARIDVVGVSLRPSGPPVIDHLRGVE